jgi:hypothetical protein
LACKEAERALIESYGRLSVDEIGDFRPALERITRPDKSEAITAKIKELKATIKDLEENKITKLQATIKELEKDFKALRPGEGERDKGSLSSSAQQKMQSAPSHHVCPLLLSGWSRCRRSRRGTRLVLVKSFCFLVCLFMPCAFHFFNVLQSAAKCALWACLFGLSVSVFVSFAFCLSLSLSFCLSASPSFLVIVARSRKCCRLHLQPSGIFRLFKTLCLPFWPRDSLSSFL